MLIPNIRNKIKRNEVFMKEKQKQLKEKLVMKKKRKVLEQNDPKLLKKRLAQNVQKTLDNKRTKNDTIPQTNEDLEELNQELQHDEFSSVLNNLENSKILLTTAKRAPKNIYKFIKEFQTIVNCQFVKRSSQFNLGHIKDICLEREFTDLIIVNHDKKVVNGLTIMHLPDGPTAYFKLSSFVDSKSIRGHATLGATNPELILNGFSTRLGTTVGRYVLYFS
jgi:ribosome production factor 1